MSGVFLGFFARGASKNFQGGGADHPGGGDIFLQNRLKMPQNGVIFAHFRENVPQNRLKYLNFNIEFARSAKNFAIFSIFGAILEHLENF